MKVVIAIDGPSGVGKGTVSKLLADKLNLIYIDTGAMYRCVAYKVISNNLSLDDENAISNLVKNINITFKDGKVFLDDNDVTLKIREKNVDNLVSEVSKIVKVRDELVLKQREMAKNHNVIMEGRDITTVVLPFANYKFYLDASLEVRAKRRYEQKKLMGINISYEEVLENIKKRDYNDMHKEVGALKIVEDATYIDTSRMSIEKVIKEILKVIGSDSNES